MQLKQLWQGASEELGRQGMEKEDLGHWTLHRNSSWLGSTTMMDVMRVLMPGIRLGTMLGRDT